MMKGKWICLVLITMLIAATAVSAQGANNYRTTITPKELVAFLEADMKAHQYDYGLDECFNYVYQVFAKMNFKPSQKYSNPKAYWDKLVSEGRTHISGTSVPVGADVFFDNGSNYLMGIYIGNYTMIINRTMQSDGSYGIMKVSAKNSWYADRYIGWAWHDNVFVEDTTYGTLVINATNFPDNNFRQYVMEELDIDGDGVLSPYEIGAVEDIDCIGCNISSIKGVEYFTELKELNCEENSLTSIDVSKNSKLVDLNCNNNQLKQLDITKNIELEDLDCGYNQITTLNTSKNKSLNRLWCHENELRELNLTANTLVEDLNCNDNNLETLDVSGLHNLKMLYFDNNNITSIDITNCTKLFELNCRENGLTKLDIKNCPFLVRALFDVGDMDGHELLYDDGVTLIINPISIDDVIFPDDNFRTCIKEFDINHDGALSLPELDEVKEINCANKDIGSLDGIKYFRKLEVLDCSNNNITYIDHFSNWRIKKLVCAGNDFSEDGLDVMNFWLEYLDCDNAHVTELELGYQGDLTYLSCNENELQELDLSECESLKELYCSGNQLSYLDLSANTVLEYLNCSYNQISSLNCTHNPKLEMLQCSENDLKDLDVTNCNAIRNLMCDNNSISKLDVSTNTALSNLYCGNNGLKDLDVTFNSHLERLECNNNHLSDIDLSKNSELAILNCSYNSFMSLDINNNAQLRNLVCCGNALKSVDVSKCEEILEWVYGEYFVIDKINEYAWCGELYDDTDHLVYGVKMDIGVDLILDHNEHSVMTLPSMLTNIEEEAFTGTPVDIVQLPEGCTSIGTKAFANCSKLSKIYLPASVTTIAEDAFENCPMVRFVTDNAMLRQWALNHGILWVENL